jgi:hypothetical protein
MFFTGENSRGIDDGDVLQNRRVTLQREARKERRKKKEKEHCQTNK